MELHPLLEEYIDLLAGELPPGREEGLQRSLDADPALAMVRDRMTQVWRIAPALPDAESMNADQSAPTPGARLQTLLGPELSRKLLQRLATDSQNEAKIAAKVIRLDLSDLQNLAAAGDGSLPPVGDLPPTP